MSGSDPAFPLPTVMGHAFLVLTKRELFAAMAMQGLMSNGLAIERGFTVDNKRLPIVEASVYVADRLLLELEKKQ